MKLKDIYKSKLDLKTFSQQDLHKIAKHFDLPMNLKDDDLAWSIALCTLSRAEQYSAKMPDGGDIIDTLRQTLMLGAPIYDNLDPYLIMIAFTSPKDSKTAIPKDVRQYLAKTFNVTDYERLEFLGDAMLEFLMVETLYLDNKVVNIGSIKDIFVNNQTLDCLAKSRELCYAKTPLKQCADYVEALIGAIYVYLLKHSETPFADLRDWFYNFYNVKALYKYLNLGERPPQCLIQYDNRIQKNLGNLSINPTMESFLQEYLIENNVFDKELGKIVLNKNLLQLRASLLEYLGLNAAEYQNIDPYLLYLAVSTNEKELNLPRPIKENFLQLLLLRYGSTVNKRLQVLGQYLFITILKEKLFNEYQLSTPGDLTQAMRILNNNDKLLCYMKENCRILPIRDRQSCLNYTHALFGALYVYKMTVNFSTAYKDTREIISNFMNLDKLIKSLLTGDLDNYPCYQESSLTNIQSLNPDIIKLRAARLSNIEQTFRNVQNFTPAFGQALRSTQIEEPPQPLPQLPLQPQQPQSSLQPQLPQQPLQPQQSQASLQPPQPQLPPLPQQPLQPPQPQAPLPQPSRFLQDPSSMLNIVYKQFDKRWGDPEFIVIQKGITKRESPLTQKWVIGIKCPSQIQCNDEYIGIGIEWKKQEAKKIASANALENLKSMGYNISVKDHT